MSLITETSKVFGEYGGYQKSRLEFMKVVKLSNDKYQIRDRINKKDYLVIEKLIDFYDTKEEAFKVLNKYKKDFLEIYNYINATVIKEVKEVEEKEEVFLCPYCKEIINKDTVVCKYCSKQIYV